MSPSCPEGPVLTVVVPNLIGLHAVEPLLRVFGKRGLALAIITPLDCQARLNERMGEFGFLLIEYRSVLGKRRWARVWHAALSVALTPLSFSQGYAVRSIGSLLRHRSFAVRLGTRLLLALPKIRRDRVNRTLRRLTRPFVENVFPCRDLLCVTRIADAHLLCAAGLHVTSLVESWDHPSKAPLGHVSDLVFVWNEALVADWHLYQGDNDVRIGYPAKLAYALEHGRPTIDRADWRHGTILYPATYSSFSATGLFEEELILIGALCRTAARAGLKIHLKPKPNGRRGEFVHLVDEHSNLEVGEDGGVTGPTDYFPTEDYNNRRLALLERCDAVFNLATTFALDSAAFGLPVFQIEVDAPKVFPRITENFTFQHLTYFTGNRDLVYRVTDTIPVDAAIGPDICARRADRAADLARNLRRWLRGCEQGRHENLAEASERMVETILNHRTSTSAGQG